MVPASLPLVPSAYCGCGGKKGAQASEPTKSCHQEIPVPGQPDPRPREKMPRERGVADSTGTYHVTQSCELFRAPYYCKSLSTCVVPRTQPQVSAVFPAAGDGAAP